MGYFEIVRCECDSANWHHPFCSRASPPIYRRPSCSCSTIHGLPWACFGSRDLPLHRPNEHQLNSRRCCCSLHSPRFRANSVDFCCLEWTERHKLYFLSMNIHIFLSHATNTRVNVPLESDNWGTDGARALPTMINYNNLHWVVPLLTYRPRSYLIWSVRYLKTRIVC
jgi:hypothetical protein